MDELFSSRVRGFVYKLGAAERKVVEQVSDRDQERKLEYLRNQKNVEVFIQPKARERGCWGGLKAGHMLTPQGPEGK